MGAGLREKPRDDYVLSTKIGRILHALKPGEKPPADFRENGLPGFAPVFDYTYDGVMRSLEHSHFRLGHLAGSTSPWSTTSTSGRPRTAPSSTSASRR